MEQAETVAVHPISKESRAGRAADGEEAVERADSTHQMWSAQVCFH